MRPRPLLSSPMTSVTAAARTSRKLTRTTKSPSNSSSEAGHPRWRGDDGRHSPTAAAPRRSRERPVLGGHVLIEESGTRADLFASPRRLARVHVGENATQLVEERVVGPRGRIDDR